MALQVLLSFHTDFLHSPQALAGQLHNIIFKEIRMSMFLHGDRLET